MAGADHNPYRSQPDHAFWSRAVARPTAEDVDPVVAPRFVLGRQDRIVTAGSCFAQHDLLDEGGRLVFSCLMRTVLTRR